MNMKTKIPSNTHLQITEIHEPKTKAQISNHMGISIRTLQRWIKKYELDVPRGLVSPEKQAEIFRACGYSKRKSRSGTK
jgi:DNA-binding transcriptional regulator LsrR (DeoR family)